MARLLYLVHRLPFPPDKGDKVRSYHLLRHLVREHEVHLGTFVDDPQDLAHVQTLRQWCAQVHAVPLDPARARLASLRGLFRAEPLSLAYYRHREMSRWVRRVMRETPPQAALVFSSSMAPYVLPSVQGTPVLLDFVDMDSAKWTEYARTRRGPMSWIHAREGRLLGQYEIAAARAAQGSYFVAEPERALFLRAAPDCADRVRAMGNGVDLRHFDPQDPAVQHVRPFEDGEQPIVFTGAMDYWPNEDAVAWFAREMMPAILARHPAARLHIVGRHPSPSVRALQADRVRVTGSVPDVRPYLRHAAVAVAPMRVARGIQNKVLEAMAMGRATVVAGTCARALALGEDDGVVSAQTPQDYIESVCSLLADPEAAERKGLQARRCVETRFSWSAHLGALDEDLRRHLKSA